MYSKRTITFYQNNMFEGWDRNVDKNLLHNLDQEINDVNA